MFWGSGPRRAAAASACGIGLAVLAAVPASAPAVATPAPTSPLQITSASLVQSGPNLVWTVHAAEDFSPNTLERDRRELCLLIERPNSHVLRREVCVRHPGDRRHPQLVVREIGATGPLDGHLMAATVTRTDGRQLTATFTPGAVRARYVPLDWQVWSGTHGGACPRGVTGLGCGTRFPAAPRQVRLHPPVPTSCSVGGPPYVTNGSRRIGKVVALTFDDGPWYLTPRFLDVLEREHVRATFFQIGNQVASLGRAVDRRMLADGDVIADHTWDHSGVARGGSFATWEILSARSAIQRLTGFTPCLFRAPYGAVGPALITDARDLGFTTIEWDVDPQDWRRPGANAIYARVVGAVQPGSIVLQHDGGGDRSGTLAALPHEIETLRARGYRFLTVPELLGLPLVYGEGARVPSPVR